MNKTAMQMLIDMMNESVKQYSDNAQQEAIFFAIIEEAKKLRDTVEKEQIDKAVDFGYFCNYKQREIYYDITYK